MEEDKLFIDIAKVGTTTHLSRLLAHWPGYIPSTEVLRAIPAEMALHVIKLGRYTLIPNGVIWYKIPFHSLCSMGTPKTVRDSAMTDPTQLIVTDRRGMTVLHAAANNVVYGGEILRWLHGTVGIPLTPTDTGVTITHIAARFGCTDALKYAIEVTGANPRSNKGFTPLIEAVWRVVTGRTVFDREIFQILINAGAHVNVRAKAAVHGTAIEIATLAKHVELAKFLVENGAIIPSNLYQMYRRDFFLSDGSVIPGGNQLQFSAFMDSLRSSSRVP